MCKKTNSHVFPIRLPLPVRRLPPLHLIFHMFSYSLTNGCSGQTLRERESQLQCCSSGSKSEVAFSSHISDERAFVYFVAEVYIFLFNFFVVSYCWRSLRIMIHYQNDPVNEVKMTNKAYE